MLAMLLFLVASCSVFIMVLTPSGVGTLIFSIPRISTDGSLIFAHDSAIASRVPLPSFRDARDPVPFLATSMKTS